MSCGIGALVITKNEASDLGECLATLSFCDERIVVDSFSEDRTPEIAVELAEHVYQRTFTTHADQKNWGIAQLTTPWVLIVDADERVPRDLAEELIALTTGDGVGYWIHRDTWFFGRRIRGAGWQRDRVLRFFRRGRGEYPPRAVHEEVELRDGARAGVCENRLEHYSYCDWPKTFMRLLSYSGRAAADRRAQGRPGALKLASSPWGRFVRQFVLQAGFREGRHGVVLCLFSAVGVALRWLKLAAGEVPSPADWGQGPEERVQVLRGRAPSPGTISPLDGR